MNVLAVAVGGAAGAVTRYLCQLSLPVIASPFHITLIINILGSLVIGIVFALFRHFETSSIWSLLAITGFLGGFTTFSTFSLDTYKLMEQGHTLKAAAYVGASVVIPIMVCFLAVYITERLLK